MSSCYVGRDDYSKIDFKKVGAVDGVRGPDPEWAGEAAEAAEALRGAAVRP
jgi:hypothetical protein